MVVMGIDPGLASTGLGVVRGTGSRVDGYSHGCIETRPPSSTAARLDRIYTDVTETLAETRPSIIILEAVFSLREYPKSGILLGKVCGVILLAAHRARTPVVEIPVREAKQILTGNGNANKEQLEKAVRRVLGGGPPIRPSHASDALALALIGLYRYPGNRTHG